MLTKNYKRAIIGKAFYYNGSVIYDYNGTRRTISENTPSSPVDGFYNYGTWFIDSLTSNPRGVGFISGGTEPTEDDYKTDGTLIKGLTCTYTQSKLDDENGSSSTINYVITNNNNYAVTIDEMCWYAIVFYSSTSAYYFLADRTRLKTPLTISAGGTGNLSYTIGAQI